MKLLKNTYFWLLALIVIGVAALPFFHSTFFRIHDYTQVARIVEMARSLQAGEFPVQWSQNFGAGYGMPLFLFYGPLPFYVGALLTFLGFSAVNAMKLLFLLSHVLAFSGMYLLMKRWGRTVAFLSATAFVWAPYRAVDIYVRGALSEILAMGLLPWILHWGFSIPRNRIRNGLGLSIGVFALLLTHNLTALIALPLLFLLSAFFIFLEKKQLWKNLFTLVAGYLSGAILSAFYTIPLFLEKHLTVVDEITGGYFDFRLHFLYLRQFLTANWGYGGSTYGVEDDISFHLGRIALLLAGLASIAAVVRVARRLSSASGQTLPLRLKAISTEKKSLLVCGLAVVLGISLFLTLTKSQFLWEAVPVLVYIQFPWRYLTVAHVFLAMLVGLSLAFIRSFFWRWTAVLLAAAAIMVTQFQYHQPERYLEDDQDLYFTDAERIRVETSQVLFDYLPLSFNRELPPVDPENRIVVFDSGEEKNRISGTWNTNEPGTLELSVTASPGATVRWNIAHFPGWQYTMNGQTVEPLMNQNGVAEATAAAELHTVGAHFGSTPLRTAGNLISLFAGGVWMLIAGLEFRRTRK